MAKKIFIAGAGGIGSAVGLLLREIGDIPVDLYLGDTNKDTITNAADWIANGSKKTGLIESVVMSGKTTGDTVDKILNDSDIILDCLPGSLAPEMAMLAKKHDLHYANLTEYVKETNQIMKIAQDANRGYILQTGLAPGFIDVLANGMFSDFTTRYGVEVVDSVEMKVGALTKNAKDPHFYGFTWSPIGVATEYIEPAIVVRNSKKEIIPSLSERSEIILDGIVYEQDITSGGAADLPDALQNKVKNLDYKTLRYPGHYGWIEEQLKEIDDSKNRSIILQSKMEESIPLVEDDIVVIYASVQGRDSSGNNRILEKTYRIEPCLVGGKKLRAIQSTTAAGLAESARMLLTDKYEGLLLQSQIDAKEFIQGPYIREIYK